MGGSAETTPRSPRPTAPAPQDRGIDHAVLCVRDIGTARRLWERFGFRVSPQSSHPFGTANRVILIGGSYIELLTVEDPWKIPDAKPRAWGFARRAEAFLKRREGFAMLALTSADAHADQKRFETAGMGAFESLDFERDAPLPNGSNIRVAFSLAFAEDGRLGEALMFACQHRTPQEFGRTGLQIHPNTVHRLVEVVVRADMPGNLSETLGKLAGREAVELDFDKVAVRLGKAGLTVLSPKEHERRFPDCEWPDTPDSPHFTALRFLVQDMDKLLFQLKANTVPHTVQEGGTILVRPQDAGGVGLLFEEMTDEAYAERLSALEEDRRKVRAAGAARSKRPARDAIAGGDFPGTLPGPAPRGAAPAGTATSATGTATTATSPGRGSAGGESPVGVLVAPTPRTGLAGGLPVMPLGPGQGRRRDDDYEDDEPEERPRRKRRVPPPDPLGLRPLPMSAPSLRALAKPAREKEESSDLPPLPPLRPPAAKVSGPAASPAPGARAGERPKADAKTEAKPKLPDSGPAGPIDFGKLFGPKKE